MKSVTVGPAGYSRLDMKLPLYRFQNLSEFDDALRPETDEPNIYGEVVFKMGEVRHRFDGKIHSVWDGNRCILTKRVKRKVLADC